MATEEENGKQDKGKGFAGLSSMVSDVEATIASIPKPRAESAENASPSNHQSREANRKEQHRPATQPYEAPTQPSRGSSAGKWLVGITLVVGLFWLISELGNNRTFNPASSPSSSPSPSVVPAPPSGFVTLDPRELDAVEQPATTQSEVPIRPNEEVPPVGRNHVIFAAQIRYCLAEKIRLDAADTVLNNYSDSEINRFNAFVDDYNSRCGEFRYRSGALERARRDIEPYRGQIQAEGRGRFSRDF
jgi:hypothetical protein